MNPQNQTPGVYIDEINAFPNSIVPVATAIPAFIGYTPKAEYQGKSYLNTPQVISSYAEFAAIYLLENPSPPADPSKQYQPEYYLVAQAPHVPLSSVGHYVNVGGVDYAILPDPNTLYYMVNSLRLFFQNGGGRAYIVSVGTYGAPSKTPLSDPSVLLLYMIAPNTSSCDALICNANLGYYHRVCERPISKCPVR